MTTLPKTARRVFADSAHQAQYEDLGYVILPALGAAEVSRLLDLYRRAGCEVPHGFYSSLWSADLDYRYEIDRVIKEMFAPLVSKVFDRHRLCLGNFAVKRPDASSSAVPMHQDWSLVDESRCRSMTIWCPLVDADEHNGGLEVVPRSHRFTDNLRPNGVGDSYNSPYKFVEELLREKYLVSVPLPAGSAIYYDSAVLHCSPPNRSQHDRVAAVGSVIPEEETLLHYFRVSPTEIDVFSVDENFYWREVALGRRPDDRRLVANLACRDFHFTPEQLLKTAGAPPASRVATGAGLPKK